MEVLKRSAWIQNVCSLDLVFFCISVLRIVCMVCATKVSDNGSVCRFPFSLLIIILLLLLLFENNLTRVRGCPLT